MRDGSKVRLAWNADIQTVMPREVDKMVFQEVKSDKDPRPHPAFEALT